MGTRCLTYVLDEECKPIVCVYRQLDGCPSVHGEDLKSILLRIPIVGGLPIRNKNRLMFNGMEELAALLVWGLKDRYSHGNIYLVPPIWPPEDHGQDYIWMVTGKVGECATVYYSCVCDDGGWHHWFGPQADPFWCSKQYE